MLDDDSIADQQDLLATYRQTLAHLVRQAARHGGESFAPPATANGLAEARANIARIKAELRALNVAIADEPNDIAPPPPDPSHGAARSAEQRTAYTGGGDYAENDIDKRQGAFVKDSTVKGAVVGENKGTININQTAHTEPTKDQKEAAELQKYIDWIIEQVSFGRLHKKALPNIKNIAASQTRALLKSINKERKRRIVTFLYEARLIGWYERDQPKVHPHIISLEKADLSVADLTGTAMRGADLSRTHLSRALLEGADLSAAILEGANITGADLSRATLAAANLTGADLSRADLRWAAITGAHLTGAHLTGAHLTEANLIGANLTGADFFQATLSWATLIWATLNDADLKEANLTGANLTGANLTGANLTGANLTGANLTGANLTAANFRGTRWDNDTQWPDRFTPPANAIKTKSPGTL